MAALRRAAAQVAADFDVGEEVGNSLVVREPVGVVGAITPWNYPLHQIAAKVAPALAAGCTVVLKPSEVAPLNAFVLADIIDEVGLPPGVFNLVTGSAPSWVRPSPPTPTSTWCRSPARPGPAGGCPSWPSATVKRVALELGGKSANVILDDADFATAVPDGVGKCYINSGQTCSALTRMLVPAGPAGRGRGAGRAPPAETFTPGDPFEDGTRLGPLVSAVQRDRVRGYINKGVDEGAKLLTGGAERPEGLDKGFFVQPTVFSDGDPRHDHRPGGDLRAGAVHHPLRHRGGGDRDRQRHPLRAGRRGVVAATRSGPRRWPGSCAPGRSRSTAAGFNPIAPFGGYKQSGIGRELGAYGLEEFLEMKSIQL